jgi:hypothetical protein
MHPLGQKDPRHDCRLQQTPSDIHMLLRREQRPSGSVRYAHALLPDQMSPTYASARSQSLTLEYHLFLVLISFQRRSTTNNVLKKATKG